MSRRKFGKKGVSTMEAKRSTSHDSKYPPSSPQLFQGTLLCCRHKAWTNKKKDYVISVVITKVDSFLHPNEAHSVAWCMITSQTILPKERKWIILTCLTQIIVARNADWEIVSGIWCDSVTTSLAALFSITVLNYSSHRHLVKCSSRCIRFSCHQEM